MVWGLGFRVWGLGFRVWGSGFRVQGLGFRVWGLRTVAADGSVSETRTLSEGRGGHIYIYIYMYRTVLGYLYGGPVPVEGKQCADGKLMPFQEVVRRFRRFRAN